MSANPIARRLVITGTVQGVWYRASTVEAAQRLGVAGWARNCADGSVEVLAVGAHDAVHALIEWAHDGPPKAVVSQVATTVVEVPEPPPTDFSIAPDA
ncbi:acylphosphatase [Nitrogeniibacter mangrovi]|uniref:acylphosphatase n=1 Tax=Nitrogeniibacter mangrovi TaxID=2016596 RepID=A0A6C1B647_9RHOO|nr:acylphosphatase [Nitrogeniibacter mangrovi]QID18913.1 acylphosphatase [Nitrogeniibacter mangrovi]